MFLFFIEIDGNALKRAFYGLLLTQVVCQFTYNASQTTFLPPSNESIRNSDRLFWQTIFVREISHENIKLKSITISVF